MSKTKNKFKYNNYLKEYLFRVYTGNFSKNKKKSKYKIEKDSLKVNSDSHNSSNNIKKLNSININKKYKNDENVENIMNGNNDNSYDNNDNYYTFVVSVPKEEGKVDPNIIKLQNMNYLSISPSQQAVRSSFCKNKEKNSLVMNNLKQKICNNTEYEFEHIFNNNISNLKKSCSANENSNLLKINSINSFYIKNKTKYQIEKKMKIDDIDESIINKNINNSNGDNKNEKKEVKNISNSNCYIF